MQPPTYRVVGMVHLLALPGAPRFGGCLRAVCDAAARDATTLTEGGVDAILIENFGDVPFFKSDLPPHTVAAMTRVGLEVARASGRPVGINCLRNDAVAAMSIASAIGATFIRVNVLCGARLTDQGVVEGDAARLARLQTLLQLHDLQVWADVDVKHSAPLAARPIEEEVWDTLERGGATALIVSGVGTGKPTDPATARRVRAAAPNTPIYVGSGATIESLAILADVVDGFIVGTHFKAEGRIDQVVDLDRVRAFVAAARGC